MSGDWLWDGSGEPDPEDAAIADRLRRMRFDRPPPDLPARRRFWGSWFAVGAVALALAASLVLAIAYRPEPEPWRCGEGCTLAVGDWLDTRDETVVLEVPEVGHLDVSPGTRIRLVASSEDQHRLDLAIGHVHAKVSAPPRLLVVDTPSAQAVDLGCEYDLSVLPDGSSLLIVDSGLVELEHPDRRAVVPAGAAAQTFRGHGPGIPWWVDTDEPRYADALIACDNGANHQIPGVLASSGPRDTLSLWHLLQRVPDPERDAVLDRIVELDPAVSDVDRRPLLALDRPALDVLFDRLSDRW